MSHYSSILGKTSPSEFSKFKTRNILIAEGDHDKIMEIDTLQMSIDELANTSVSISNIKQRQRDMKGSRFPKGYQNHTKKLSLFQDESKIS